MDSSQYPNRISHAQAAGLLKRAGRVLICGHINPDGDCIGSMAALAHAMRSMGKTARAVLVSELPLKYRFVADMFTKPDAEFCSTADLVAVLDTPSRSRLEIPADMLPAGKPVVCIDHHPVTLKDFNYVLEDRCEAAAGCILYEVFRELGVGITPAMADCLYAALITDTGRFTNRNTSARVFELALNLVNAGADPFRIAGYIYQSATVAQLRLLGAVLETLELVSGERGAILYLTDSMRRECDAEEADTENFVNYARSIHGVETAALLSEEPGCQSVKISLRSNTSAYDVSALAGRYGGGGHPGASGATVSGSLGSVLPEFKSRYEQFIQGIEK